MKKIILIPNQQHQRQPAPRHQSAPRIQGKSNPWNPAKSHQIKVNQTKSNLFFYHWPPITPNWVHGVDHRPPRWLNLGFKAVLKGFKVI
ncbi:MAG: hypothetical protein ABSF34_05445 [Verrucomicrobiota bacterium]